MRPLHTRKRDHPSTSRVVLIDASALASVWKALCLLPMTQPCLWLFRSGAIEATALIGLVLLDGLPRLWNALGAGVLGHG